MDSIKLSLHNTKVLMAGTDQTVSKKVMAELVTGSRLTFTLYVESLTGGPAEVIIRNTMSQHVPLEIVETLSVSTSGGRATKILTDVHNCFEFEFIPNGTATFYFGVSIADNAATTRIDNAQIAVDLDHTEDSVTAYQGGEWTMDVVVEQQDEITVFQGTDPWIIGDLVYTKDSVTVHQGTDPWIVQQDKLDQTTDSVTSFQGTDPWIVQQDKLNSITDSVTVIQGTNPWIVQQDKLDQTTDSITSYQGTDPWIVQQDKLNNTTDSVTAFQGGVWIVESNDLDIRNLNHIADLGGNYDSSRIGDGENEAAVSANNELHIRDTHDNGGLDVVIPLTTTPVQGMVGVTTKAGRKYVIFEGLDTNIVWGFSNTTQSFDVFKSQLLMVPVGPSTEIWFKMKTGTGSVAFGELS